MAETIRASSVKDLKKLRSELVFMVPYGLWGNVEAVREMINPKLVKHLVSSRVNTYVRENAEGSEELQDWLQVCFTPFLRRLSIEERDWGEAISNSGRNETLFWFFSGCLHFSNPAGHSAACALERRSSGITQRLDERASRVPQEEE
jgi:hypothetical protein